MTIAKNHGKYLLPAHDSVNYVPTVPKGFEDWVMANEERIARAKSMPYFLSNNASVVNGILGKEVVPVVAKGVETRVATSVTAIEGATINLDTSTSILSLSGSVPNWEYVGIGGNLTNKEKLNIVLDNLEQYYGRNTSRQMYIDLARTAKTETESKNLLNRLFSADVANMTGDMRPNYESINHLRELRTIGNDAIISQWRGRYNDIIKELNAYDFTNKGYKDVYTKIEEAYNIYKLSGDATVKKLGFENISHMTPYNFFTEYAKKYPDWINQLPPKEFFDSFKEFVPLVNGSSHAFYSQTYKYVQISLKDADYAQRLASVEKRQMVIPHEYGHAYDTQNNLRATDIEVKSVYENWKKKVLKDNGVGLENTLKKELANLRAKNDAYYNERERLLTKKYKDLVAQGKRKEAAEAMREVFNNSAEKKATERGIIEKVSALSDCLHAAIDGSRPLSTGWHPGNYFKSTDNQIAEFFAHCSENYWAGNDVFKRLAPQLYKEMCDLIKKKWKIK